MRVLVIMKSIVLSILFKRKKYDNENNNYSLFAISKLPSFEIE